MFNFDLKALLRCRKAFVKKVRICPQIGNMIIKIPNPSDLIRVLNTRFEEVLGEA
jgi:hypothetical protein